MYGYIFTLLKSPKTFIFESFVFYIRKDLAETIEY